MIEINDYEDFIKLLKSTQIEHNNYHFNFTELPVNINIAEMTLKNKFINCKFSGKRIDFLDLRIDNKIHEHIFVFDDCEILSEIYFKDCYLQEISFNNCKKTLKSITITPTEILYLSISGVKNYEIQNINFTIQKTKILKHFYCDNINSSGGFNFIESNVPYFRFNINTFASLNIEESIFTEGFSLGKCTTNGAYISKNTFTKGYFEETHFGLKTTFKDNIFNGLTNFNKIKNDVKTHLEFLHCDFFGKTYFNNAKLYKLELIDSKFYDVSSFQDTTFTYCKIDRVIFEKNALFDNIEILFINRLDKKTVRNIKQQLNKTDNIIDYDKFKIYELNSHKIELFQKFKQNNKLKEKISIALDYTILWIGSVYSRNGRNWFRAVNITLIVAMLFYVLTFVSENYKYSFSISEYNDFLNGFFRFLVVTDYYNPIIKEREYLQNFSSWIPFLLGKIFISIGIYETVVSFRKFKK